jgi:uncharacterized protein YndB with AHSA1/START domain
MKTDAPFGTTPAELEDLFAASDAGLVPEGRSRGTALVSPQSALGRVLAGVVRLGFWQGKVFEPDAHRVRNLLTPLSVLSYPADVTEGPSLLDGRPCIVLDYSKTTRTAAWIRDEIREVAPGRYLGLVYLRRRRMPFAFWLSFPRDPEEAAGAYFALEAQTAEWALEAPIRIQRVVDLDATPEAVFAVLADHERWPTWFGGMRRVHIDGPAEGPGALRTVWIAAARVQERFVVWEPPSRLAFTLVSADLPGLRSMVEDWVLTPREGGCRLTITIGAQARRPLEVAAPLVREAIVRSTAGATGIRHAVG